MKLTAFQIVNYKSCNNVYLDLEVDNPNIFIGINDCGKSTILNAVGLLLEERAKFNFFQDDKTKKDLSNSPIKEDEFHKVLDSLGVSHLDYSENCCFLFGKFILEEHDAINDISTHLQWVLDEEENDTFFLCRKFDNSFRNSQYLLLTPRGKTDSAEYYKERATALSKIAKEKGADKPENRNGVGRFTSLELLRSIMKMDDLELVWSEYKFDKNIFPQYRYLDWHISMDQLTQITNDVMQAQIESDLKDARSYADDKRIQAQKKINKELETFKETFLRELPNIEKLKANIYFDVTPKITDLLINKKNSIGDIHIDSQGEGIKRQIWFQLIKWNALNAIQAQEKNKRFLWCFDEPETHLYPTAQRDFYDTIKKTTSANVQSLISTHSTIFVDKTILKSINKVDLNSGITTISKCNSVDDIYESLRLKNSDFLFYDKFIVVEGDTEESLIPHCFKLATGCSIEGQSIKIINLGGKDKIVQNALILEGILGEFKKTTNTVFYILDNDASFKLSTHQKEKYSPTFIGKQDIEDSISSTVWMAILENQLEKDLRLSIDEIDDIKNSIKSDAEEDSKKKFYPALIQSVRKKMIDIGRGDFHTIDEALPSKGLESGKLIAKFLDDVQYLPENLIKICEKIMDSD
ncbi:AAA family ATPase [Flavobacterium alkalisoli]|uniref:AAA family ATPase n=1 Tax=Flavobacterium alkalisoli TaxID=2602769 RepID=A0A5B9FPR4_9FLAO|nr:AAA family ATPase [Flavobacterium alkalisoli]QEE48960.1 AAA family ATPase [Flavobacterium alkalisoli]